MTEVTPHQHAAQHPPTRCDNGTVYEVCECGASRMTKHGETPAGWHTCKACTHPWGLG